MTKLGATRFIAQRVIGHKEAGVGSVYDRYEYLREKASALNAWAAHVERITSGGSGRARGHTERLRPFTGKSSKVSPSTIPKLVGKGQCPGVVPLPASTTGPFR
jgi:hypothetical protein